MMVNFVLHLSSIKKQLPLSDEESVMGFVGDWINPPISDRLTIRRVTKTKYKVNDVVRVVKPISDYVGKVGVIIFVNHRSNHPYLVKIGEEIIGYQHHDLELVTSIKEYDPLRAITVDKRSVKSDIYPLTVSVKINSITVPVLNHYDEANVMLEDIKQMITDKKNEEITIFIGGNDRV